jgi:hypothetical protein
MIPLFFTSQRRRQAIFFMAIFLGLSMASSAAVPAAWVPVLHCRRAEGNVQFTTAWGRGETISFLVHHEASKRSVRVELTPTSLKAVELGADGRQHPLAPGNYFAPAEADSERPDLPVTIKFREDDWSFYLDGVIRASMAAPFLLPAQLYWPRRSRGGAQEGLRFQPVPRVGFTTDFMIEEGAPNELYPWVIQQGSWRIHTAQAEAVARPETDQKRAQEAPLTADKSPNFYSLKGGGQNEEAIITTGYDFFDNYHYTAALQPVQGEAGLLFYHRDAAAVAQTDDGEAAPPDPAAAEFYALTLLYEAANPQQREIRLWQQRDGVRRMLARAQVPLYDGQWYLPGVKLHGNEIICYLDRSELFRVREALPVGGKIGLYARTPEEIRFDDVTLAPYLPIELGDLASLRYNVLQRSRAAFNLDERSIARDAALRSNDRRRDAELIIGRAHSRNMAFAATIEPAEGDYEVALLAGWQDAHSGHWRFQNERSGAYEISRLLRVDVEGVISEIDRWQQPVNEQEPAPRLLLDATQAGSLRCLRNGVLLHFVEYDGDLQGANGLWVKAGSTVEFSELSLAAERFQYIEQEQKNPIFRTDSFMRHWASPEGQWVGGPHGALWHKGDFFGDYSIRMPCVPDSELHLAVADEADAGAVQIRIKDGKLLLSTVKQDSDDPVVQELPLQAPEGKSLSDLDYELFHEGRWLWLTVDGKTALRQVLDQQLKKLGTRAMVKGMNLEHLARSKVTRVNVIDEFFNESPYAWLANGGDWQIINRFQCTPSWSHMIGEAPQGLAAFWRKQVFSGDLTLEFYAGTRQGYYDEAGNLNCTIMAADTSTGSGYTAACTEWDQNLSQNWTTLYKNGRPLARSDSYLVPRRRKGMVRRILNPLVAQGRPMHGAWFYIKLRKIGDSLEYYFDDELIFREKDPEMIQEGLVGIWTFVHSITLAQIKIAFGGERPRKVPVTMLPVDDKTLPPSAAATAAAEAVEAVEAVSAETSDETPASATATASEPYRWQATAGAFPLDSLAAPFWQHEDNVGQSQLIPFALNADALLYRNLLGGGDMRMTASLPALPLQDVAGWRFKMKRTANARINLFYSVGVLNAKGEYELQRRYFHHISGPEFSDGPWRISGSSELPAQSSVEPDRHQWTELTAWIPSRIRATGRRGERQYLRLEGFGLQELDAMANGIWGNGPGEAYAVSQLQPIFYELPELSLPEGATISFRKQLTDFTRRCRGNDVAELSAVLAAEAVPGINSVWLEIYHGRQALVQQLTWIKLPEELPISFAWDEERMDTLRLSSTANYVDKRFAAATIHFADERLQLQRDNPEHRLAALPRNAQTQEAAAKGSFSFLVNNGVSEQELSLPASPEQRRNAPPALFKIDGFSPLCLSFENGPQEPLVFAGRPRMAMESEDGANQFLSVRNTALGQELSTPFNMDFSVANYPVVQFRYRAWDMAQISMIFQNHHYVRLAADDSDRATAVRHGHDLRMDEQWHSWVGLAADAFTRVPYAVTRFMPKNLRFASLGSPDQTGRYSRLQLDDLVFGPAVTKAEQLSFTPHYYDVDGVEAVFTALLPGEAPLAKRSAEEQAALNWQRHEVGQLITPEITELSQGVHHLLLKAMDKHGAESAPMDLPFLWDTVAPTLSHEIATSTNPAHNGTQLLLTLNNQGGAPWCIEKASFFIADKEQALPQWTNSFIHSQDADRLELNYPFLFRNQLNAAKDGDVLEFAVDNIVDGAGNGHPRYTVPIKVDYKSDKTGPSWYAFTFADSVNWFWNWDGYCSRTRQFSPAQHNGLGVIHNLGQSAYLNHRSYYATGTISQAVSWRPARHPCLSFRLMTPHYRPGMILQVLLTSTAGKQYSISLNKAGKGDNELNREVNFAWENNQWQHFSFNVREMLQAIGVNDKALAELEFKTVAIQRRGVKHNESLNLDDFFIHGLPADQDKGDFLRWTAFDASGVASLLATCVDANGKDLWSHEYTDIASTDLAVLRAKVKGSQWFRCQAKDHAGNLSLPFWLPIYGE